MAPATLTWRGKGGSWTGTFVPDADDKKDKKANGKTPPGTGGARDRRASKTRDGKPRDKR